MSSNADSVQATASHQRPARRPTLRNLYASMRLSLPSNVVFRRFAISSCADLPMSKFVTSVCLSPTLFAVHRLVRLPNKLLQHHYLPLLNDVLFVVEADRIREFISLGDVICWARDRFLSFVAARSRSDVENEEELLPFRNGRCWRLTLAASGCRVVSCRSIANRFVRSIYLTEYGFFRYPTQWGRHRLAEVQ